MNENVTIQDLLTALLYWRSLAKELQDRVEDGIAEYADGYNDGYTNGRQDAKADQWSEATHARPQS